MIIVVVVCFIKTLAVLKEVKKKRIDSTYMFWFKGNDDDYKTLSKLNVDELKSCIEALGIVLSETGGETPKPFLKSMLENHLMETEFVVSGTDKISEPLLPRSNAPAPRVNNFLLS
jgi:hypothetical protein